MNKQKQGRADFAVWPCDFQFDTARLKSAPQKTKKTVFPPKRRNIHCESEKLDKPPNISEVSVVPADAKSESGLMVELFADRPDVLEIIDGKVFGDKENKKPLSPEAKLHIKNSVLFTLRACGYNV